MGTVIARKLTFGSGTVEIRAPRVEDRRVDEEGEQQRFTSRILPPYMRRSPRVAEVLPVLYLRGLSTGISARRWDRCSARTPLACPRRTSRD
jgi:hypothetical protein